MTVLRRAALGAGALLLLAGALVFAAGRLGNVGPLAQGAPDSWLYVVVSRGLAEDIEIVDTASGQRLSFALSGLARDIAISADRRTLYVAMQGREGRILLLDALRGGTLRVIHAPASIDSLIALPQGRLAAISVGSRGSIVFIFDEVGTELARVNLAELIAGRPVHDARRLYVPAVLAGLSRSDAVAVIELAAPAHVATWVIEERGSRGGRPALAIAPDGGLVAASYVAWGLVALEGASGPRRSVGFDIVPVVPQRGSPGLIVTAGGLIHACIAPSPDAVRRYVVSADFELRPTSALGARCGRFHEAPGGEVYLVVAGRAELQLLDPRSGEVRRTLPLTGNAGPSTN